MERVPPQTLSIQSRHGSIYGFLPPSFSGIPDLNATMRQARANLENYTGTLAVYDPGIGSRRYFYGDKEYKMLSWSKETGEMLFTIIDRPDEVNGPKNLLQALMGAGWEFVFAYDDTWREPIVTSNPKNALSGKAFDYFTQKCPEHTFRISTSD